MIVPVLSILFIPSYKAHDTSPVLHHDVHINLILFRFIHVHQHCSILLKLSDLFHTVQTFPHYSFHQHFHKVQISRTVLHCSSYLYVTTAASRSTCNPYHYDTKLCFALGQLSRIITLLVTLWDV